MTKDKALRLALEALENITSVSICEATHHAKKDRHLLCEECPNEVRHLKAITAIKAALEAKDEYVSVLQKPTSERAWFTIAELNAWADKKLSENPHWVMPKDEPERDEPPPQRTWVGLTRDEILEARWHNKSSYKFARVLEAKLKEKNT